MDDSSIIEETKRVFQPYYKDPLSNTDALEIHDSLVGLLELLLSMDKKNKDRKEMRKKDENI